MSANGLPAGWRLSTLGELGRWTSGGTPSRSHPEYYGEGVPWVKTGDLPDGPISSVPESITRAGLDNSAAKVLPPGTLLVAMYGATIGKLGLLECEAATNQACAALLPNGTHYMPFVFQYLRSQREELKRIGQGGAQPNISQAILKDFPIPLPPPDEQRRIVARLESLQARSQRAREALDAVPPLLEKLRQSILAAAFRGDLTKEWRAKHPDVEPASGLLERIRTERRKQWEQAELSAQRANGRSRRDDRWRQKYRTPVAVDAATLPDLPKGWCWTSLDEVLTNLRNGISAKPDAEDGLRILRISAVRPMRLDLDDVRFLKNTERYSEYVLSDGDLLITRYNGNPSLVGVAAVMRGVRAPTVYPDKLIRAVPLTSAVSAAFLELALNTGLTRNHIRQKSKTAAGQVGISGADIRSAAVPVPPLEEQRLLVEAVGSQLGRVAQVTAGGRALAELHAQLEHAILAQAFKGRLTNLA